MPMRFHPRYAFVGGAVALLAVGAGCSSSKPSPGQDANPPATEPLQIKTLSNRADMISGGDAMVEIILPAGTTATGLHVTVGSTDVSSAFATRANGRVLGLVTGLANGANTVTADLAGAGAATLTITNHGIGGPVFSGPQVKPFTCATLTNLAATDTAPPSNASGLSTLAIDDQCNIATEFKLYYHTTDPTCVSGLPDPSLGETGQVPAPANNCFKTLDPTAALPADLAMTTTDTGKTVPYIVRVERGTINRGIFDIAVLFDPSKDDPSKGWSPFAPQDGWNGKLLYMFGASSGQPRQQFRSEVSWTNDAALSRGFLVAVNSMTDSLFNSNRITMVETVMMMKEKIIDTYGEVRYTLSNGCSGGSINQLTTASIFPGLLDGIQPTCTYSDSESTGLEVSDCALLANFYNSTTWATLQTGLTADQVNAKKAAINGHLDQSACHAWVNTFANLNQPGNYQTIFVNPSTGATIPPTGPAHNNCFLLASQVYDATANPTGVRCTGPDHDVAIVGTVGNSKIARSVTDNVGVQYGLKAFLAKQISADEFIALNAGIGGQDADSNFTPTRSQGDPDAIATLYRAGMISDGAHLAKVPIIDTRGFDDTTLAPVAAPRAVGIHLAWRSQALRARLDAAGGHGNHVLWRFGTSLTAPPQSGLSLQSFLLIDQWVAAIKGDSSDLPIEQKILAHKPASAFDFCYATADTAFADKITNPSICDLDVKLVARSSPRQIAGGPVTENILKCQLKPVNRADYALGGGLTDDQFAALQAAFPAGVCDFSLPGVNQQPAISPLDFSAGPGGVAFPSAPQSAAAH